MWIMALMIVMIVNDSDMMAVDVVDDHDNYDW